KYSIYAVSVMANARVESINNKIKLFILKAYGFRNMQNMLDMILLGCSNIFIHLPNRGGTGLKVA
ncbi:MAG: transposase, partial [Succinivibrio sp.]|nr:transposase [Succinivibrio sp.]